MLSQDGFDRGSTFIKQIKADDVGKLTGIILKGSNTKPYQCMKIRVETGPKFWNFDCDGEIVCPEKCEQKIELQGFYQIKLKCLGQTDYKITIFNGSKETKIPIFFQIVGQSDFGPKKVPL